MSKLSLKIITPEKTLLETEADAVYSTSVDGQFGVLPGHVPYMTPLGIGVTEYIVDSKRNYVSTIGGIFQVKDNVITVLTDNAELGDKIDTVRANAAKERAEARLKTTSQEIDVDRAQLALAKAMARIHASSGRM